MINTIDLFAGCGGLTEGFRKNPAYNTIACVEWDKHPYNCLRHRFQTHWNDDHVGERILRFDIQRAEELFNGWDDPEYGHSEGLDSLVSNRGGRVDLIVGGPPCQAYSVAGRVRDENGMRNDYRNYLFEKYLEIVMHYKPAAFVFENVPGILSAMPGDGTVKIIDVIHEKFLDAGYVTLSNLNKATIDFSEFGVPQNRKRVIILGLSKTHFKGAACRLLECFYKEMLPKHKVARKKTVRDAIYDLPALYPLEQPIRINGKQYSHSFAERSSLNNHSARFNNKREIDIFRLIASDIESGRMEYTSTEKLKELYTRLTGKKSNIHKYYVLRWGEPSNTIPAHLYKDGLRHIHPDSRQARSITVREAARLQTFPDDFEFITNTAMDYKMIGNAVPPLFSGILSTILAELLRMSQMREDIPHK